MRTLYFKIFLGVQDTQAMLRGSGDEPNSRWFNARLGIWCCSDPGDHARMCGFSGHLAVLRDCAMPGRWNPGLYMPEVSSPWPPKLVLRPQLDVSVY